MSKKPILSYAKPSKQFHWPFLILSILLTFASLFLLTNLWLPVTLYPLSGATTTHFGFFSGLIYLTITKAGGISPTAYQWHPLSLTLTILLTLADLALCTWSIRKTMTSPTPIDSPKTTLPPTSSHS